MKNRIMLALGFVLLGGAFALAGSKPQAADEVLALERKAMDGWKKGDAGPALSVADAQISYCHIMTNGRVDGAAELKKLYLQFEGKPLFDSYQMENTRVQTSGKVAVLSYVLVTHNGSLERRWNATQVYERQKGGWKVIHSHFSQTNPPRQPQ